MGYDTPFAGQVESIGRGIADANDATNSRGLPAVNPVFTWVRLAQRIPVRVSFKDLPPDVVLVAGMTASIDIGPEGEQRSGLGGRMLDWVRDNM